MAYNPKGGVPSVIRGWSQELRKTNEEIEQYKSFIKGRRGKEGMTPELEAELAISANPREVAAVLRDQVAKIEAEITNEGIERAKEEHTTLLAERKARLRKMEAEQKAIESEQERLNQYSNLGDRFEVENIDGTRIIHDKGTGKVDIRSGDQGGVVYRDGCKWESCRY